MIHYNESDHDQRLVAKQFQKASNNTQRKQKLTRNMSSQRQQNQNPNTYAV